MWILWHSVMRFLVSADDLAARCDALSVVSDEVDLTAKWCVGLVAREV